METLVTFILGVHTLQACLQMDPDKRPTCEQLLQLPYFAGAPTWFTPEFHGHQVRPGCHRSAVDL